jgi:protein-S-isoprenylcysteine O-methyltransferase Ste14
MAVSDGRIIAVCWLCFIGFWLISAFGAKQTISRGGRGSVVPRVAVVIAAMAMTSLNAAGVRGPHTPAELDRALGVVGVALCITGVVFAIWARVHLGRNWGMPMSVKADPELITSGPYRLVRHPIYTGVMVALGGSALVNGMGWWIVVAAFAAYFLHSASSEEREMARRFPSRYPQYQARTKRLVPYIL